MYQVGSIVIIKRQIFNEGYKNSKSEIDHSKKRPAIVIAEDEENFYYLTLTSRKCNEYKQFSLEEIGSGHVTLENIYEKKICGMIEKDYIDDKQLLKLLTKFYNYHSNLEHKKPMFKKIEKIILKEIKGLTIKTQNKHRK